MSKKDVVITSVLLGVLLFMIITTIMLKDVPNAESKAIDWIFKSPKPIKVYEYKSLYKDHAYILVNAEDGTYKTGLIRIELPEIIK